MQSHTIKSWAWIHKWSSLVCTVFMLLLCLTGLPLIFHHEIGHLLGTEVEAAEMPANTPRANLDRVMDVAKARHPGKGGMFVSQEPDDDRVWYVTLSDTPTSESNLKQVAVDARTGVALAEPKLDQGFMFIMFSLHVDYPSFEEEMEIVRRTTAHPRKDREVDPFARRMQRRAVGKRQGRKYDDGTPLE